jgi:hypothetical protein
MVITTTKDGSIVNEAGNVLCFSIERFVRDIVEGDCCFVCGIHPSMATFNDEHVIPDWILRRFNLHSMKITLPNRASLTYGGYKVPCCKACNSRMGDVFEVPLGKLIADGYEAVYEHVMREGPWLFFKWLTLIFLKTHLKDKSLCFYLDPREGGEKISKLYEWETMHHIHCIGRSFYTGAQLDPTVIGSLLIFQAHTGTPFGEFDYRDFYPSRAMLFRLGEVGLVAVLNDSCAAGNLLREPVLRKITGPVSPPQFRELMARMAYANLTLKDRPVAASEIEADGRYIIRAVMPQTWALEGANQSDYGKLLFWCCEDIIAALPLGRSQSNWSCY